MTRLILLTRSPRLHPGTWKIDTVTPAAAGKLIASAARERQCINLITYEETLDVIYDVSGVSFPRHDQSPSRVGHRTDPVSIEPRPGDVFLSVTLIEKQRNLTENDFIWFTVTVL